ncbi:sigma-70 family RNA polymerase sigma factor [Thalassococcus sp. BH17M4-6]|uniref:sigma-70 family RNA polymerase sigma factor n=1 Tax=Thalassococcus sp. BH17M4-6 TaxID=3413148 RepID=UPI003BDD9AAC
MAELSEIENMIARTALGDRQAFSQLYDATSSKLFGVVLRVLNNRASAEDVLQESYMKIWRHSDRYQSNGMSPMTWLITIARNTAIDRLRATRDSGADVDDMADRLVASGPTPEQSAIAAGEASRITACLDELDTDKGQAVRGAYLQGLSYAELAEKFSVPLNTMRTWLRRSLISLRECMER